MIKKVFPILALAMFSSTLGMGIVAPFLPLYARSMGASSIWLGIIFAAFSISNSLCAPFIGRLSDQKGRKLLLVTGLLAYSLISLGYLWAKNAPQLSLVRLIQGIAGAMTFPIATAYVGDLAPEGEEGRWMGYANTAFWSGFSFGPLTGGILTDHFGTVVTFYTMGGLNLLAFLIALFYLPESTSRKKNEGSTRPSFKEMSQSGVVKGIFSFRLAEAFGSGGNMTFLPIFATTLGLDISRIGILLTTASLLMFLLTPLGGIIADRFNRRVLIVIGISLFVIPMVILPMARNFSQLLTVLLIQSIGGAISMPSTSALAVEEGRKYSMGSTMSIFFLAMSIGSGIGPIVSGGIVDLTNINAVFYLAAAMGVIGASLFIWFTRKH